MKKLIFFAIILLCGFAFAACTPDAADCQNLAKGSLAIRVENAWSRSTDMASSGGDAMAAGTSAAYMVIQNCGPSEDRLIGVDSDVSAAAGMHVTQTQNGVTMMGEVNQIEIPAGKKVELKPGGLHIMMMELHKPIKAGDEVHLILTFAKAGQLQVAAVARNP